MFINDLARIAIKTDKAYAEMRFRDAGNAAYVLSFSVDVVASTS